MEGIKTNEKGDNEDEDHIKCSFSWRPSSLFHP